MATNTRDAECPNLKTNERDEKKKIGLAHFFFQLFRVILYNVEATCTQVEHIRCACDCDCVCARFDLSENGTRGLLSVFKLNKIVLDLQQR